MASVLPFFIVLFILLPCSLAARNNVTIQVRIDSLTAGDQNSGPWISPSRDFAFGFHKLENKDLYLLAIWYNNIPNKTIVWWANGDNNPALAPPNSKVELNSGIGLRLTDHQGNLIWRSGISTGEAANGFLQDTGNFVVSDRDGQIQWQSFDNPTDTLLPAQVMQVNGVLSCRLTMTNFSRGRYQFRLLENGDAVLKPINLPAGTDYDSSDYDAYFRSYTVANVDESNKGKQVVFNESGYLYILRANNKSEPLIPATRILSKENYYRATLNFDGVFVIYSHPKSSTGNWSIVHAMPDNICSSMSGLTGTGPCGANGICMLAVDHRPMCKCPEKFSLIDPSDEHGGCKPDFPTQICDGSTSPEEYTFQELFNTNWPYGSYQHYIGYDVTKCQEACRNDCLCNAVILEGTTCWKMRLPLVNGRQDVSAGQIHT